MSDYFIIDTQTPTQSPVRTPVLPTRFSPRKKTVKSLAESLSRAAKIKWTRTMNQILFNALLKQISLGRKADNEFKKEAHSEAAVEVYKRTQITMNWQNVQNRMRYHKREYNDVEDMLAVSGFGWDSEQMSHPRVKRLRGKWIERMDDLAAIVVSDHATGRYAQGSKNMAASSSRIQRDLNDARTKLDDEMDVPINLSEDHLGDSTGNYHFSNDSHRAIENRSFRSTPNRANDSESSRGGSASTKRMHSARPCDVLGSSLDGVAEAMRNFGLRKEINPTSKVFNILEEVQGLNNTEFIEVG
ncbi:uncharacterized protein LOC131253793 [Magnolia sinica]|uniref:uncharacterized protein LOC131253793 n=1 Tax=Magnolia sinica TaxID=86752 RepID=UPI00265A0D21|nr:uncharacterized protein LOC131253793 [Magnolia sinica]